MTHDKIAAHFLAFWIQESNFIWKLADNCPNEFWKFVAGLPAPVDMDMLHNVLECMVARKEPTPPGYPRAVKWLASTDRGPLQADILLNSAKPPKQFRALVVTAYKYEQLDLAAKVRKFFDEKFPIV